MDHDLTTLVRCLPPGTLDEAMDDAGDHLARAVTDTRIAAIADRMLRARRLFAVGYAELQVRLEELEMPVVVGEVILNAGAETVIQPGGAIDGLALAAGLEEEASGLRADAVHRAEAPALGLSLGFASAPGVQDVPRDPPIVLIGPAGLLRWAMREVVLSALGRSYVSVVHLTTNPVRPNDLAANYLPVPDHLWGGIANASAGPRRLYDAHLRAKISRPPDIILCDDLAALHTAGYDARSPVRQASDGLRRLAALGRSLGAGVCGLLAADDEEVRGPAGEGLRNAATVIRVRVMKESSLDVVEPMNESREVRVAVGHTVIRTTAAELLAYERASP